MSREDDLLHDCIMYEARLAQKEKELKAMTFMAYVLLLVCIALFICLVVANSEAATLRLSFVAPSTNADNGNPCGDVYDTLEVNPMTLAPIGGSPLTDLKEARVYGKRISYNTDVTLLGVIPLVGKEGQTIPFDLEIYDTLTVLPDSTITNTPAGWIWVTTKDFSGNESCVRNQYAFSFPGVWPAPAPPRLPGLNASYYKGLNFNTYCTSRVDSMIDFDWGYNAPFTCTGVDSFSIRWVGELYIATTGTYTLYASTEDGVRLWVNGIQRLNNWVPQGETEVSWTGNITAGYHTLQMDYFARNGHAAAHLRYSGAGIAKQAIPASSYSH